MPVCRLLLAIALLVGTSSSGFGQESQPPTSTPATQPAPTGNSVGAPTTQPGTGPGHSGGPFSGGAFRVGGDVKPPKVLYDPDPVYSDEARHANFQGTVILWLVVDASGLPQMIRVQRSLGMGLDEQAIAAVKQWKFQPATKNGEPVRVMINVEVNFHLYQLLPHPDSAGQPPRFPGVKTSKYPLVVRLTSSSFRGSGATNSVVYKAVITDAGQERQVTISCLLAGTDCLSFQAGAYPATWKDGGAGLEILGVLGTNGKWTKTEYTVVADKAP